MAFRNSILAGEELVRSGIRSENYVPGVSGWRVGRDGSAEFLDVLVRGELITGVGDPRVEVGPDVNGLGDPGVAFYPDGGGPPTMLVLVGGTLFALLSGAQTSSVVVTDTLVEIRADVAGGSGVARLVAGDEIQLDVPSLTHQGRPILSVLDVGAVGADGQALSPTVPYSEQFGRGVTSVIAGDYHRITLPTAFPTGLAWFQAQAVTTTVGYSVSINSGALGPTAARLHFRLWNDTGTKIVAPTTVLWRALGF